MIYHCNACRFNFERYSAVSACPDCGKQDIREANAAEKAEVMRYRKEFGPVTRFYTTGLIRWRSRGR